MDAGDFTVWRDLFGTSSPLADANGNGIVGVEDFLIWQTQFGREVPASVVPEPAPLIPFAIGLVCLFTARRRR